MIGIGHEPQQVLTPRARLLVGYPAVVQLPQDRQCIAPQPFCLVRAVLQESQGPKRSAAEKGFVRWRRDNPDGFVVNCGSRGWILHRTTCPNLKPDDETACMTRNRKVCSEDRWSLNAGLTAKAGLSPAARTACLSRFRGS